jgi:carbon storage regulator
MDRDSPVKSAATQNVWFRKPFQNHRAAAATAVGVKFEAVNHRKSTFTWRVWKMLVLTRKVGERIVIGDNIVITVIGQKGGGVKLGFEGPADVPIHRAEVYQRLQFQERPGLHCGPSDFVI